MNPKSPHDLSELDLLKKRVKDLEKQLGKQDADSENKMHLQAKVLDQIQDTVTITDLLGNITYVNQAQVQKFQRSKEDFIGRPVTVYGYDPERGASQEEIIEATLSQGQWQGEVVNYDVHGQPVLIDCKTILIRNENGQPVGMCGIGTDITQQIRDKEALLENEIKYQSLFTSSIDAIAILGGSPPKVLFANPAFLRLFGYTLEEILAFSAEDIFLLVHPEDRDMVKSKLHSRFRREEMPNQYEFRVVTKGGEVRRVEVSASLFFSKEKIFSQAIYRDITERKLADETIKAALQEKEVLLREIHHRVKNNLQVISSLLYLQASRVENAQVRQVLFDSQQRIHSMAMIHEVLYSSQQLAAVDLSDYLKRLVNHLQDVFNTRANIRIVLELDKVELDINQAVPCSLILNELITNAFKHAFPGRIQGTIQIKLHLLNDREAFLEVRDNGVGFSADSDPGKPASLGLMLVQRLLKKQLKGSLNVASEAGATFTLRWPLPDNSLMQAIP